MERVLVDIEKWSGSKTVRIISKSYSRISVSKYKDKPAKLTPRQAHFYRSLIAIALAKRSNVIPVDFIGVKGQKMYLDHGCIKIAEHAGFIEPLANDKAGVVSAITLRWKA